MARKEKQEVSRVVDIKSMSDQAIKPRELVQITGHQNLSLNARRAITILWHHAHMQGVEVGKPYTIELSELRSESNRSMEQVEDAIEQLMTTILYIRRADGSTDRVQFLGGTNISNVNRPRGVITFYLDTLLVNILKDSSIWAKIAVPVLMAFTSKYTVSLYENACQWLGLEFKTIQEFTLEEIRDMMGVEDGKYKSFGDLNTHVLTPAAAEINALAPFNVTLVPIKMGRKVASIRVHWWRKTTEELQEAYKEAARPKVGRKARISGKTLNVISPIQSDRRRSRVASMESENDLIDE